ncbi:MAG: TonB-dependent receptor plug domain-containing protein, partial [Rhodanobacter sp.]
MHRHRLLCLLISSALIAPLAHAETSKAAPSTAAADQPPATSSADAADKKTSKNGEPIVTLSALRVTAQLTSAATARMIQQYAPNMVNVIPATMIEKLPDVNAAEAVRRIPGISLETDTGEGRFVNIRGLDADL